MPSKLGLLIGSLLLMVIARAQQPKLILPIGHTGRIHLANFSCDGKKILTASFDPVDGSAKLWDAERGALLADIKGNDAVYNRIISAGFSPDCSKLLTAEDHSVKIWDAIKGVLLADLEGHTDRIASAYFSPDAKKVITASQDSTAKIWDASNGSLLADLKGHANVVRSARFSNDGKKIVTASNDKTAKIWDAGLGSLLVNLKGHTNYVISACFSPDDKKIITSSRDNTIKIWDALTGKLITDLKGIIWADSACFLPGGKRIVIKSEGFAQIWDAQTGKLVAPLKEPGRKILGCWLSPDGKRMVTTFSDNSAKILDLAKGMLLSRIQQDQRGFREVCFSPDNKKIAIVSGREINIRDAQRGTLINTLEGSGSEISNSCFSPDSKKIVTFSWDNTARIWDVQSGVLLAALKGHSNSVTSACFSPDGSRIITGSNDYTAKIWDAVNGVHLISLEGHRFIVSNAGFSSDGKKVATASKDGTVKIWDVNGFLLTDIKAHTQAVNSACFSPDGKKVVTAANEKTARVWEVAGGRLLFELNGHNDEVYSASFSPDGKKIVTASWDHTAKIWDAESGLLLVNFTGHTSPVTSACFSPDAKTILTASNDGTVRMWDAASGKELKGFITPALGACFSPDGKNILAGTVSNTAQLWDVESGSLLRDLKGHTGFVTQASFSPDGKRMLTASEDNTAKVWDEKGKLLYTFFSLDSSDYFLQLPAGYYYCTRNAAKLLHYVDNDLKVITFEQLDVKYNRPDLVLGAIGSPDTALIRSYKKAWQKRITKLGFDTSLFTGGLHVPEADIQNRESIRYEQASGKLSLTIHAKDDSMALDRYNIWVNEVPLFGVRGISLKSRDTKQFDTSLVITLSNGSNRIETSVTNVGGLESYRIPLDVKYIAPRSVREKLYFIGIGIDKFNDSRYNLSWSVKDIRDLCRKFKEKYGAACIIDTLFNKDVDITTITALKQKLLKTTENDRIILAYSGHGLLSKDYDYFLSAYNVDFQQPQRGGLPYEVLEGLLDGIPARKKLMLIDACHSGEVDKEELSKMVNAQAQLDSTKKGVIVLTDTTDKKLGTKNSFELMQEVFVNVGRSTGATVISAAAGTQFALERGDLKNGVFSYSILELMNTKGTVNVSGLKRYVNKRVSELTHGMQVPTSRSENKVMDWQVW